MRTRHLMCSRLISELLDATAMGGYPYSRVASSTPSCEQPPLRQAFHAVRLKWRGLHHPKRLGHKPFPDQHMDKPSLHSPTGRISCTHDESAPWIRRVVDWGWWRALFKRGPRWFFALRRCLSSLPGSEARSLLNSSQHSFLSPRHHPGPQLRKAAPQESTHSSRRVCPCAGTAGLPLERVVTRRWLPCCAFRLP